MDDVKNKHFELLKQQEGYRQYPYYDTKGILTIGYGRNLESKGILLSEAEYLLTNDVKVANFELNSKFEWFKDLDAMTQGVLINMVVNMGILKFSHFDRMIDSIVAGNREKAALEMKTSLWARQLPKRADTLSKIMLIDKFSD